MNRPNFKSSLLATVFLLSLLPGPLIHELINHHDHCVVHLSPGKEDVIGSMHRHCELLQLEGPVYLNIINDALDGPDILNPELRTLSTSSCFYQSSSPSLLRGPPGTRA
ncbi:MAG: hypothetical protein RL021_941 [Bacteroidota bacterium]|jgi:hypothetical protein